MKKAKTKAPARKAAKMPRQSDKPKAPPTKKAATASARSTSSKGRSAGPTAATKTGRKATLHMAEKSFATAQQKTPELPRAKPILPPMSAATAAPAETTAPKPAINPASRADVPPETGFTLQVDGHFKNQFETLAEAKQAATELKSRFPILRIEIYDAQNKTRLPV
jgi:hypothetical protein